MALEFGARTNHHSAYDICAGRTWRADCAVSIADRWPGGLQTVQLKGNGVALAMAAPSGTSATIIAGQMATYKLVVSTGQPSAARSL